MNRLQMLLVILMEECNETSQRASKALRFTLEEIQPDQPGQLMNNADRLIQEFNDLFAVMEILQEEGHIRQILDSEMITLKRQKIEKYLIYSEKRGVYKSEQNTPFPEFPIKTPSFIQ